MKTSSIMMIHPTFGKIKLQPPPTHHLDLHQNRPSWHSALFSQLLERKYENFITVPINMMYYVLQGPYRFYKSSTDDELRIYSNTLHQVICSIIYTIALFIYCNEAWKSFVPRSSQNPVDFLTMFLKSTSCVHHIIFVHIICTRKFKLLKIVQYFAKETKREQQNQHIHRKVEIILFCCLFVIIAILSTVLLHGPPRKNSDSVVNVFFELRGSFFEKRCNLNVKPIDIDNIDDEEDDKQEKVETKDNLIPKIKVALSYFVLFSRILLSFCTDAVISTMILGLYTRVRNFAGKLEDLFQSAVTDEGSCVLKIEVFNEIKKEYESVCSLIDLVNETMSRLMFTYLLETVFFYSVYLKELVVVDGRCISVQLWIGFLFFSFCFVFYMSAELSNLMDQSKIRLLNFDVVGGMNQFEMLSLRLKLQSKSYGITGFGYGIINYSLVTSVCSTLLTYFIISVQFQVPLQ